MKTRLLMLAVLTAAAALAAPMTAVNASEVSDLQWGYWWAAQTAPTSLPAPPQVPSNGLYAASSPTGLSAISALGFQLPTDSNDPKLVLHIASYHAAGTASIAAYPATGSWSPATAGTWSERPTFGPLTTRVVGVLSADQTTMTFALGPLIRAGAIDVVIAPVPTSTAPAQYPAVDVAFAAPKPSDITTTPVVTTPASSSSDASSGGSSSAGTPPSSTASSTSTVPAVGMPASIPPVVSPGQPPAAAPVVAPPSVSTPNGSPAAATAPVASGGRSTRDTLILAFLLANALTFLLQRGRHAARTSDVSIYDLPPTSPAAQSPADAVRT